MPIPTPPPPGPNNGGFIIISYSNGSRTHRMKFHVAPFSASTGTYTSAQGTELNVSTTAAAIIGNFRGLWRSGWTFHFAAMYQYQSGVAVEIPVTGSTSDQVGAATGADSALGENFYSLNFRTTLLGRGRVFLIEPANWVNSVANYRTSGDALLGTVIGYLTGGNTGVVGHDGGYFKSPARFTSGQNKKLRRRYGNA